MNPGDKIGSYEIVSTIAAGGMGVVYRAKHATFHDERAIKFLLPNLALKEKIRHRFLQEANVQYQLDHPNIVKVHDLIDEGQHLAMVMDFIEGPTMEDWLEEQEGPISFEAMMSIMEPILQGVGYAHQRGTVHRDLKPANVLLKPISEGVFEPKITDFGLVKVLEDSSGMTRTGTMMGTVPFMSPEQFIGSNDILPSADVFALGIMCWRMLSGNFPVNPRNQLEVAEMYAGRRPIPALAGPAGIAIANALQLDPKDRPENALAFLEQLLSKSPVAAVAKQPTATSGLTCPACHATVQANATFCGNCGHSLQKASQTSSEIIAPPATSTEPAPTQAPAAQPSTPPTVHTTPPTVHTTPPEHTPANTVTPAAPPKSNKAVLVAVALLGVGAAAFFHLKKGAPEPAAVVEHSWDSAFIQSQMDLEWDLGIAMVRTNPGGSVKMGSSRRQRGRDKDESIRYATLSQPFALSSTEVTQAQWKAVMNSSPARDRMRNWGSSPGEDYDPCNQYGVGDAYPVHCISWYEAIEFTNRLSTKMGLEPVYTVSGTSVSWNRSANGYRLPTEAEWAYAARLSGQQYGTYQANVIDGLVAANPYGSDSLCDIANVSNPSTERRHKRWTGRGTLYCDDGWADLAHVAQRSPVGGLYDMTGNLWEWVWDGYTSSPSTSAPSSYSGGKVVLRGGAWQGPAADYRLANRYANVPNQHSYFVGFRIAQNVDDAAGIKAPITLASATRSNGSSRDASKLIDGNRATAWCSPEGQAGGSKITLQLPTGFEATSIAVANGYQKKKNDKYGDRFIINGRVARLVADNPWDTSPMILDSNSKAFQYFKITQTEGATGGNHLTFELNGSDSYVPGAQYDLACISEIEVYGNYGKGMAPPMAAVPVDAEEAPPAPKVEKSIISWKARPAPKVEKSISKKAKKAKKARPSVRLGSPIILGALDKSLIDRVVKRAKNRISYCYEKELTRKPSLKGKIVVKFTITGNGSVSQAKTKSSSMKSSAVESCIISRFRSFKFPKPKNSGFVMVQYPLTFSSK